jgi:hypothetical protein
MFEALLISLVAGGADPPPVYQVENKVPPAFIVVNKIAKPAAEVRQPPRPFSEPTPGTIAPARSGTARSMSAAVASLPPSAGSVRVGLIRTVRVPSAGPAGATSCSTGR